MQVALVQSKQDHMKSLGSCAINVPVETDFITACRFQKQAWLAHLCPNMINLPPESWSIQCAGESATGQWRCTGSIPSVLMVEAKPKKVTTG